MCVVKCASILHAAIGIDTFFWVDHLFHIPVPLVFDEVEPVARLPLVTLDIVLRIRFEL